MFLSQLDSFANVALCDPPGNEIEFSRLFIPFFLRTLKTVQEVEIKDSEYRIQINTYTTISRISMNTYFLTLVVFVVVMRFPKDRKGS